jgi:hypothetical protein
MCNACAAPATCGWTRPDNLAPSHVKNSKNAALRAAHFEPVANHELMNGAGRSTARAMGVRAHGCDPRRACVCWRDSMEAWAMALRDDEP